MLVGHGDSDSMVPLDLAKKTYDTLRSLRKGDNMLYKTYRGMDHQSCPEEMRDVEAFLLRVLPPIPDLAPSKL